MSAVCIALVWMPASHPLNLSCAVRSYSLAAFLALLSAYFTLHLQDVWQELPYIFNGQKRIKHHHPGLWAWENVAVVHYVDAKPWDKHNAEHTAFQVRGTHVNRIIFWSTRIFIGQHPGKRMPTLSR